MKKLILLVALLCYPYSVMASELSSRDAGTFVLLGKDYAPTGVFYRLSQVGGKWVAEGKLPNESWKNISCDSGCEYRSSVPNESTSYLPAAMRSNTDISCIQNTAQAFCKYVSKSNSHRGGYVIVALVTGKPVPMFIKRIQAQ